MSLPRYDRRPLRLITLLGLAWTLAALRAAPVRAQPVTPGPADLADRARFRFGPFYLQPWISVTNAGLDTNVFDDYEDAKEDYTATITPGVEGGVRAGVVRLNGRLVSDYVWYRTYKSEQGVDTSTRVQFEVRWFWLRPWVASEWARTRSRVSAEIDARAQRSLPVHEAGVDVRLASRTWLVFSYRRQTTAFLAGEVFRGIPLDEALNHLAEAVNAGLRLELTPLTTLSLGAQATRARFVHATFRNAESLAFLPALDFSPEALLNGRAAVGYRRFVPERPDVPVFAGLVASVGLGWTPLSGTSFGIGAGRDVAYSFEFEYPYYVQTEASASAAQHLVGSFDVTGQARRVWLDYQPFADAGVPARTDRVTSFGGGARYRFGELAQLGLDVERVERRSDRPDREYRGLRVFGSVRYGF
jgi:hypothetical protein